MIDSRILTCVVALGHPGDTPADWRCTLTGLVVCSEHRRRYEQRPDLGPYRWERT